MTPLMTRDQLSPYELRAIKHFKGVDHNESIAIGPNGEAYVTSFYTFKAFRLDLASNEAIPFADIGRRTLGQVVDADNNLYCAECDGPGSKITRVSQDGSKSVYCDTVQDGEFLSLNTPVFDRHGDMYVSDTGTWSEAIDGHIYKISAGGGVASRWTSHAIDTPNGIAIDAAEKYIYFVETWGHSISRIEIKPDGNAGACERILHMPKHVPDGIAFDDRGRLWIACHRPDSIYVYDLVAGRLELFAHDWQGEALRGPCHLAFAGVDRGILLASSLDRATVHRFDNPGARGLRLHNPSL